MSIIYSESNYVYVVELECRQQKNLNMHVHLITIAVRIAYSSMQKQEIKNSLQYHETRNAKTNN